MSRRKVESDLARIASRHVEPEHIETVLTDYAKHIAKGGLTNEELNALSDNDHEAFMKSFAARNPDKARKKKAAPRTW